MSIFAVSANLGPILGLILKCQESSFDVKFGSNFAVSAKLDPLTQPGYNFLKGNYVIQRSVLYAFCTGMNHQHLLPGSLLHFVHF